MAAKELFLTLTVLLLTFTLTQSCFFRGFICIPTQNSCTRRGGMCTVQGGNCVCASRMALYQDLHPFGLNGRNGRRGYVEPEHIRKRHPFGEQNIEQQTKLWSHLYRLYNVIN